MVGLPLIRGKEKWTEIEKKRWVFTWDTYRIMGMIATEISKLKLNNGRTFKVKVEIPTKIFEQTLSDEQWDEPRPSKTCPENITQLVLIVERARFPYLRVYQNEGQMRANKDLWSKLIPKWSHSKELTKFEQSVLAHHSQEDFVSEYKELRKKLKKQRD